MDTQPHANPRGKPLVAIVLLVTVFLVLYLAGIVLFVSDSRADTATLQKGTIPGNHLVMHVTVNDIDPVKQTFTAEILPEPTGSLTDDKGTTAKKDITYAITTGDDSKSVTIKAGDPISGVQLTMPMSGNIDVYPFDSYTGYFTLSGDVPMILDSQSIVTSYHAAASLEDQSAPGQLLVDYTFDRSQSTRLFALFLYLLMAVLATVVVVVTVCVVWRNYGLDFGKMTWGAALLFVLPGVRAGLPGQPPIGTIGDFLDFFWAEILVVTCTVLLVFHWVKRDKPPS